MCKLSVVCVAVYMCIGLTAVTFLYIVAFIPESAPRCLQTRRQRADAQACATHPVGRQRPGWTAHPLVGETRDGSTESEVLGRCKVEPASCGGDGCSKEACAADNAAASLEDGVDDDGVRPLLSRDVMSSTQDAAAAQVRAAAGEPAGEGEESANSSDTSPLLSPAAGSSSSKDAVIFIGDAGQVADSGARNKSSGNLFSADAASGGAGDATKHAAAQGGTDQGKDDQSQQEATERSTAATLLAGWQVLRQNAWYQKLAVIWVIVSVSITAVQAGGLG